jgi:hypothetical protein
LKNKIAVIGGVGNARYGKLHHIDDYGLTAQAFSNAVADLGIDRTTSKGSRLPHPVLRVRGRNPCAQPALDDDLPGHCHMSRMGIIAASVVIAAGHVEYAAPNANIGHSRQVNCGRNCSNAELGSAVNVVFGPAWTTDLSEIHRYMSDEPRRGVLDVAPSASSLE